MGTSTPSAARVSRAARAGRLRVISGAGVAAAFGVAVLAARRRFTRPVTAYVVSGSGLGPGAVTPIRTATNTAEPPIPVGKQPNAIAITPNGKTAYVTGGTDSVTPIRTATNTAGPPITVGTGPDAIAIS